MKEYILVCCLIIASLTAQGQYADIKYIGKSSLAKGDAEVANGSYAASIKYYEMATEEMPTNAEAQLKLAKSYWKINDMLNAEKALAAYIKLQDEFDPEIIREYIEALASNKNYEKIKPWVEKYQAKAKESGLRIERLDAFSDVEQFNKDSKYYSVSHLTVANNWSDMGPSYYKEGYLFISDRHEKVVIRSKTKKTQSNYLDIYYTQKKPDGGFMKPTRLQKNINTKYHEGPLCTYQNNSKVVLTRNNLNDKKKAQRSRTDDQNKLNLYFADIENDNIKNISQFQYNSPEYNNAHPAVAEDGSYMIYASDQPGGLGDADLYITYATADGGWSEPENLGPKVNTKGSELYPSLTGNVLYFASNGQPGLGGMDVYKTVLTGKNPGKVTNLGSPVNSSKDDFGLITKTGREGYFVSNRRNELFDVIYSYNYTKETDDKLIAHVYAIDTISNQVLSNTAINVVDTRNNQFLAPFEVRSDTFTYVLDTGVEYSVIAARQQYFTNQKIFFSGSEINDELDWPVPLDSMAVGKSIRLDDIYYDFDKATLRDSSKYQLNYLIVMLQDNPTMKAELHSYTDTRGSESYNMRLSKRRAKSVVDYMVTAGIREDRLVPVGFGESEPLVDCEPSECTEEDHQLNRRTELLVTDL